MVAKRLGSMVVCPLDDVLPSCPLESQHNSALGHTITGSQCSLRNTSKEVQTPCFSHLGICKARLRQCFTVGATRAVSAFHHHVVGVVLCGAEKEVIRAHARRIITMMANIHSFRNGTIQQFPRDAVGLVGSPPVATNRIKGTIPVLVGTCLPYPTFLGFNYLNLLPETLREVAGWLRFPFFASASICRRALPETSPTAKPPIRIIPGWIPGAERHATDLASRFDPIAARSSHA